MVLLYYHDSLPRAVPIHNQTFETHGKAEHVPVSALFVLHSDVAQHTFPLAAVSSFANSWTHTVLQGERGEIRVQCPWQACSPHFGCQQRSGSVWAWRLRAPAELGGQNGSGRSWIGNMNPELWWDVFAELWKAETEKDPQHI